MGFVIGVVPAAVPLVVYKLIQDLGLKVDLENEFIKLRRDDEIGPTPLTYHGGTPA